jgi:signal transduction histidine kinase
VLIVNRSMRRQALVEAEEKARLILDRNLAIHTYYSHELKPGLFELTDPIVPDTYFDPTWMSSTYAVREIDHLFRDLSPADYYYKEAAVNARMPGNEADAFERAFIQELNENPDLDLRSEVLELEGEVYFVTLRRGEVLEESCLRCHDTAEEAPEGLVDRYGAESSFGREVGEVISTISIRIPISEAYAQADRISWQLSGALVLLLGGLFGIQALLYRSYLINPLRAIQQKASQITSQEEHLGEMIPMPPGRELTQLIDAFNQMSANLRRNRDELETRVRERTGELQEVNVHLSQEIKVRQQAEAYLLESHRQLEQALADLEAAQDELVQQERLAAVGQLSAGMAHELNNVMASVKLYTEMSLRSSKLPRDIRRRLQVIAKQTDEATRLVQQMVDFGRQAVMRLQPLEMVPFIDETVAKLAEVLPDSIEIETMQSDAESLAVMADPERLRQAIFNLAFNGRDAMPEGGTLRVELSSSEGDPPRRCSVCSQTLAGKWIKIAVSDTGTGISVDVLPFLFEPFFTTRAPQGRGLGLAQLYGIVNQHQGHILVETVLGRGSTFTLYLSPFEGPAA